MVTKCAPQVCEEFQLQSLLAANQIFNTIETQCATTINLHDGCKIQFSLAFGFCCLCLQSHHGLSCLQSPHGSLMVLPQKIEVVVTNAHHFLAMMPCVIPHNALVANEAPCNCLPQAHNAHSAHISKAEPWALPAVCHVVVPGLPPVVTLRGPGHTNQMRCTDLQGLLFHQMEPHPLSC